MKHKLVKNRFVSHRLRAPGAGRCLDAFAAGLLGDTGILHDQLLRHQILLLLVRGTHPQQQEARGHAAHFHGSVNIGKECTFREEPCLHTADKYNKMQRVCSAFCFLYVYAREELTMSGLWCEAEQEKYRFNTRLEWRQRVHEQ
jgi:hypothetical protein